MDEKQEHIAGTGDSGLVEVWFKIEKDRNTPHDVNTHETWQVFDAGQFRRVLALFDADDITVPLSR